jgi:hypothetical protein
MQVGIDEAAATLGESVATVRRRVKADTLTATRVATPAGYRYLITLPDGAPDQPPDQPPSQATTQNPELTTQVTAQPDQVAALTTDQLRSQDLINHLITPSQVATQPPDQPPSQTTTQPPDHVSGRGPTATLQRLLRQAVGLKP